MNSYAMATCEECVIDSAETLLTEVQLVNLLVDQYRRDMTSLAGEFVGCVSEFMHVEAAETA